MLYRGTGIWASSESRGQIAIAGANRSAGNRASNQRGKARRAAIGIVAGGAVVMIACDHLPVLGSFSSPTQRVVGRSLHSGLPHLPLSL
jgi:hypothetical protein